ncbi:MAG: tRNA glutamyl-Q(34) synthetase GluQRS [Gammaproteobacteria bacterium]|nr:tRNA glutamyl-Q(34) synthetase GluQRS [Gammaproteobacteria bacterium]
MNLTNNEYRGRFAPSPSGQLHFGSLVAAISSYLQAKSQQGQWLLRIEDVDQTREVAGSASHILSTLDKLGFEWDGSIIYQSQQTARYAEYLQTLIDKDLIYACDCSRSKLKQNSSAAAIYPGNCRLKKHPLTSPHALRCRVSTESLFIKDQIQPAFSVNLQDDCGDFIIKRRDQFFAYQLAVVVDDHEQCITDIIRGADLLSSTPQQIYLQKQLGFSQPSYGHIPVAMHQTGLKLSKSHQDLALGHYNPLAVMQQALVFLNQSPPAELAHVSLSEFWQWAINNWHLSDIPRLAEKAFTLDIPFTDTL